MEVDEIKPPGCKFPRISSNDNLCDGEEEIDGEQQPKRRSAAGVSDLFGGVGRFYGWPSSRIVRVSRASGGKDRHSKVLTCKGLRDRRVRLSVSTAIQFYDLQDRLGYDQPSKAVEWLLKAAASSIEELPPMDANFPDTPKLLSNGKRLITSAGAGDELGFDSVEVDVAGARDGDPNFHHHNLTKSSACSSPSETSKGSGLSLSRSEYRVKARNRAKGRIAEKEKENENQSSWIVDGLNPISQTTSFTELLSVTLNTVHGKNEHNTITTADGGISNESHLFQKSSREWSSSSSTTRVGQINLATVAPPLFSLSGEPHPGIQHYSIFPDHLHVPVVNSAARGNSNNINNNGSNESNLNFNMSSSSGFHRGTLQSNSSSSFLLPHLQRFPTIDGHPSIFIGTTAPAETHHQQFLSGLDARLQLYYGGVHGNNDRQSDQKGNEKN